MKKIIAKLSQLQSLIKTIFFISVSILVISEIIRLRKTISMTDLKASLGQIPISSVILMLILGIIAVSPMLLFDIILNQEIKSKHSLRYILETSWVINTINNIAGFAGIVDIGLRYSFYSNEKESSKSMQGISRIIPYFMSGLSIFCGVLFVFIWFLPVDLSIKKYWFVLFGTMLYLPLILIISSNKKLTYFGQTTFKRAISLIGASLVDWFFVITYFCLIGYLLGVRIPLYNIVPLFLIALIIGMVSMIPGGIGSFDVVIITGLTSLGLNNSIVVTWLLLYRLFYYVVPFSIGVILFFKHMGGRINERYLNIPGNILKTIGHHSEIISLRIFGFFMILSALIPDKLSDVIFLNRLDPIQGQLIWQMPSVLIGLLFILLARFVKRKLRISYPFAWCLFVVTIIYVNLVEISDFTSIFLILIMFMMFMIRKRLNRHSFIYSWEDKTKDLAIIVSILIVLLVIGGNSFWDRYFFSIRYVRLDQFIILWTHLLIAVGLIYLVYRFAIFYVSRETKYQIGQKFEQNRYLEFLQTYGGNTDSGLAFLNDKRLYWFQVDKVDKVVFQFSLKSNKCIVMGDPAGDTYYFREATEQFIKDANNENLDIIFYEVDQSTTLTLHEFGYEFMKFGESALVDLNQFSTGGKKGKQFRNVVNKAEKSGLKFEIMTPPFSQEFLDQIELVSTKWLNGRQEKGFSLGFFNRDYLQNAPIAVVRNEEGNIIAFVNFLASYCKDTATIDLMRYESADNNRGLIDFIFIKLFSYFKEEGLHYFDLGMAPLSNVGNMESSFVYEKIAYLIFVFSTHFYSFSGLRQYKQKFTPIWQSKYIAYPKKTWLIYDMILLLMNDKKQ